MNRTAPPPDAIHRVPGMQPMTVPIDLKWLEIPHPKPFVCGLRVMADYIGTVVEHVSNIECVRWLDRAAELHADSLGSTRRVNLEHGMMWFVARHEIDYFAEAWLHDELVIATWVRDVRKVKSWRDYVIARPADHTVVCRAATLWVLVDLQSRRPIRISQEMAARFQPLHSSSTP